MSDMNDFGDNRDAEPCNGVIKKLFPAKRYGFAVCECIKHTGEAHFNYSDLLISEAEQDNLVIGWRLTFSVIKQERPTGHCFYRAINVRPVEVMVVQCEVLTYGANLGTLQCRELANRHIFVTRERYNGSLEAAASEGNQTCRTCITWNELKVKQPQANHCSQDAPTISSPVRKSPSSIASYPTNVDKHLRNNNNSNNNGNHGNNNGNRCLRRMDLNAIGNQSFGLHIHQQKLPHEMASVNLHPLAINNTESPFIPSRSRVIGPQNGLIKATPPSPSPLTGATQYRHPVVSSANPGMSPFLQSFADPNMMTSPAKLGMTTDLRSCGTLSQIPDPLDNIDPTGNGFFSPPVRCNTGDFAKRMASDLRPVRVTPDTPSSGTGSMSSTPMGKPRRLFANGVEPPRVVPDTSDVLDRRNSFSMNPPTLRRFGMQSDAISIGETRSIRSASVISNTSSSGTGGSPLTANGEFGFYDTSSRIGTDLFSPGMDALMLKNQLRGVTSTAHSAHSSLLQQSVAPPTDQTVPKDINSPSSSGL